MGSRTLVTEGLLAGRAEGVGTELVADDLVFHVRGRGWSGGRGRPVAGGVAGGGQRRAGRRVRVRGVYASGWGRPARGADVGCSVAAAKVWTVVVVISWVGGVVDVGGFLDIGERVVDGGRSGGDVGCLWLEGSMIVWKRIRGPD